MRNGAILAVKGLGGYHLACDPFNREAVRTLRSRKARQDKAFALMVRDVEVWAKGGAGCQARALGAPQAAAPAQLRAKTKSSTAAGH